TAIYTLSLHDALPISDLQKQRFYRGLERVHMLGSLVLAVVLYFMGGWPWVVWGVCVRLVSTYHITWFVNSASHTWGYKNFKINRSEEHTSELQSLRHL